MNESNYHESDYYESNYHESNYHESNSYETSHYESDLGLITMEGDGDALTGLWIEGQRNGQAAPEGNLPVFALTRKWLDIYFSGKKPDFMPPLKLEGTDFQKEVWEILLTIPYGMTTTYGEIAAQIAKKRGLRRMSAQAVGQAVGHNPISILVPCHRVVGGNGNLTGYAGGIDKKIKLLSLEGLDMEKFFIPQKSRRYSKDEY